MATKDYYLVLGVPRDESEAGIRSAFRDLARRHHPDRAGPSGTPHFREVVEAYRVLSDPGLRREHDAELREQARPRTRRAARPVGRGERSEPLLCDVALSREEARRGGVLPIHIPIARPCALCHGAGSLRGRSCRGCDGRGEVGSEVVIPLEIPPQVRPGSILEASLEPWGIHDLWLRAHIGVADG
jgi:DnaJ-class molecular chaperone